LLSFPSLENKQVSSKNLPGRGGFLISSLFNLLHLHKKTPGPLALKKEKKKKKTGRMSNFLMTFAIFI